MNHLKKKKKGINNRRRTLVKDNGNRSLWVLWEESSEPYFCVDTEPSLTGRQR